MVRECVLGYLVYPVGCGTFVIENCVISNGYKSSAGLIALRSDTPVFSMVKLSLEIAYFIWEIFLQQTKEYGEIGVGRKTKQ